MSGEPSPTGLVYVVDDNEAVRDAISWLVEEVGLCVRTYATAEAYLADVDPQRPACLVLDVRMPGMSGLALQEQLTEQGIAIPVIIITGHGDVPMAVRAMKAGAFEFLQKPFNDQALLDCIFAALEQHTKLLAERQKAIEANRQLASLTRRESEVLELLRAGQSTKDIAESLHISVRTVEGHRLHLLEKMNANTIAQLIEIANQADVASRSSGS